MGSTIATSRAALFAMLAESTTLGTAEVTYGPPITPEGQRFVSLLGVALHDDRALVYADAPRKEEYRLEVGIWLEMPETNDPAEVETEAVELVNAIRVIVLADYTLRDTVSTAFPTGVEASGAFAQPIESGGWGCDVRLFIDVTAYIDTT